MGITSSDIVLIEKAKQINPGIKSVCELGSQNLYLGFDPKPPFASVWYQKEGIDYSCIDLAGDNHALKYDLGKPFEIDKKFDLVTDFGTSEHVVNMEEFTEVAFHEGHINSVYPKGNFEIESGFYNCWKNKHALLEIGGLMINVNPKTEHWPGHGYTYITEEFYHELVKVAGYEIVEIGENCAMGNCESGKNIFSILRKISDQFPSMDEFSKIKTYKS